MVVISRAMKNPGYMNDFMIELFIAIDKMQNYDEYRSYLQESEINLCRDSL